jgi:dehydrogenase/reductase SDR family protein 1
MLIKTKGLVVNISSAGGETYWSSIIYGIEKAGADRMMKDMAEETGSGSVTFLSLWPGFVRTEKNMQPGSWNQNLLNRYRVARELVAHRSGVAVEDVTLESMEFESQRFCGMAVAALAADKNVNELNGRVVSSPGVAVRYGYSDVDGTIPDGWSFLKPRIWRSLAD